MLEEKKTTWRWWRCSFIGLRIQMKRISKSERKIPLLAVVSECVHSSLWVEHTRFTRGKFMNTWYAKLFYTSTCYDGWGRPLSVAMRVNVIMQQSDHFILQSQICFLLISLKYDCKILHSVAPMSMYFHFPSCTSIVSFKHNIFGLYCLNSFVLVIFRLTWMAVRNMERRCLSICC